MPHDHRRFVRCVLACRHPLQSPTRHPATPAGRDRVTFARVPVPPRVESATGRESRTHGLPADDFKGGRVMERTSIKEPPGRLTTVSSFTADGFTDADGWSLWSGGVNLYDPDLGIAPGSVVEQWGRGIGYTVRGCAINGHVLWYRTEAEDQQRHEEMVAEQQAERRRWFEEHRGELDAKYDALPEVFQRRIDRFRAGNPDFRWEFEGYELAACEAALMVAGGADESDPRLDALGLSGNQFGFAKRLAYWFTTKPENVVREHGAMVPLTGCEAYGCTHEAAP